MTSTARKLQHIGNGTGILLSAEILQASGLRQDDDVLVHVEDGSIVITRIDPAFDAMVAAADRFVGAHPNAIKKLADRRFAYPPWPSSLNIDMP